MYHYVRDTRTTEFPQIRALPPESFEQQLDWLQSTHVVVTNQDLETALDGGAPLPQSAALLTFDDGFVDHFETVWPALRKRGLAGTFFLSQDGAGAAPRLLGVHKTHFLLAALGADAFGRAVLAECNRDRIPDERRAVFGLDRWEDTGERAIKQLLNYDLPFDEAERVLDALFTRHVGDAAAFARRLYLSDAMVREMADGAMTFGYHTRSHRMLSRLDRSEQAAEIKAGIGWIRRLTGQQTVPFCYPWGGRQTYTEDTLRLLGDAGYSHAFNTVRRRAALGA